MDPLPSMQEKSGRGEPSKTQLATMPEMNELQTELELKRYVQGVKRWFQKQTNSRTGSFNFFLSTISTNLPTTLLTGQIRRVSS